MQDGMQNQMGHYSNDEEAADPGIRARHNHVSSNCADAFPYGCYAGPIPAGTLTKPTRIMGEGWATGCLNPPQLYGVKGQTRVVNIDGSNNVIMSCIEITDHYRCGGNYGGGNSDPLACRYEVAPPAPNPRYTAPWAADGIVGTNAHNLWLNDVNIHGLGNYGIAAGNPLTGGVGNWQLNRVSIVGNSYGGINFDTPETPHNSTGVDGFTGYLRIIDSKINNNGCVEYYDHADNPFDAVYHMNCYATAGGGYGDALGSYYNDHVEVVMRNTEVMYNASDGPDFLYFRPGTGASGTFTGLRLEGNFGNQLKLGMVALVQNSIIIGNCASGCADVTSDEGACLAGKNFFPFATGDGSADSCRGSGAAIAAAANITIDHNTIISEGDCILQFSENAVAATVTNNIFKGMLDWREPYERSCLRYSVTPPVEDESTIYTWSNNVVDTIKADQYCDQGIGGVCTDPEFPVFGGNGGGKPDGEYFNVCLDSGSPFYNLGVGAPNNGCN